MLLKIKNVMSSFDKQLKNRILKTIEEYLGSRYDFSLYFLNIVPDDRYSLEIGIKSNNCLSYKDIYCIESYLKEKINKYDISVIDIDKLNIIIQKYALETSSALSNIKRA